MTGIAVLPYCVWAWVCVLLHRNIKAYSSHFTISEIRLFLPKIATHIDGYLCRHIPPNPVFSSSIYII